LQQTNISLFAPDRTYIKLLAYTKSVLDAVGRLLRAPNRATLRKTRLMLAVKPWHSMLSTPRLFSLYEQAAAVRGVPGDVVECGVWRGGGLAMMGAACADVGVERHFWAFDSFAGLPPPGDQDGTHEREKYYEGLNLGDADAVKVIWHRLGLAPEQLNVVPGWFEETLPDAPIEQIAVLHVDGDWYGSVKTTLDALYDRVASSGVVIVDDYAYWEGCRRAVDEFMAARGLSPTLLQHDAPPAVYFYKP
jgi:O-methyltransferase